MEVILPMMTFTSVILSATVIPRAMPSILWMFCTLTSVSLSIPLSCSTVISLSRLGWKSANAFSISGARRAASAGVIPSIDLRRSSAVRACFADISPRSASVMPASSTRIFAALAAIASAISFLPAAALALLTFIRICGRTTLVSCAMPPILLSGTCLSSVLMAWSGVAALIKLAAISVTRLAMALSCIPAISVFIVPSTRLRILTSAARSSFLATREAIFCSKAFIPLYIPVNVGIHLSSISFMAVCCASCSLVSSGFLPSSMAPITGIFSRRLAICGTLLSAGPRALKIVMFRTEPAKSLRKPPPTPNTAPTPPNSEAIPMMPAAVIASVVPLEATIFNLFFQLPASSAFALISEEANTALTASGEPAICVWALLKPVTCPRTRAFTEVATPFTPSGISSLNSSDATRSNPAAISFSLSAISLKTLAIVIISTALNACTGSADEMMVSLDSCTTLAYSASIAPLIFLSRMRLSSGRAILTLSARSGEATEANSALRVSSTLLSAITAVAITLSTAPGVESTLGSSCLHAVRIASKAGPTLSSLITDSYPMPCISPNIIPSFMSDFITATASELLMADRSAFTCATPLIFP